MLMRVVEIGSAIFQDVLFDRCKKCFSGQLEGCLAVFFAKEHLLTFLRLCQTIAAGQTDRSKFQ